MFSQTKLHNGNKIKTQTTSPPKTLNNSQQNNKPIPNQTTHPYNHAIQPHFTTNTAPLRHKRHYHHSQPQSLKAF